MEKFLLKHGEQVIDVLGSEVDRVELEIKVRLIVFETYFTILIYSQKQFPEVRHVDLEIL